MEQKIKIYEATIHILALDLETLTRALKRISDADKMRFGSEPYHVIADKALEKVYGGLDE